jgi:rare lipoprotein A (peptidoglycan hydrolase)
VILRLATLAVIALFGAGSAAAAELPTFPEQPQTHQRYSVVGMASWYGTDFHGHPTANGEIFDMRSLSAAHRTMPLPSYARVTNLGNGRSIVVRVNDRGPFVGRRILDVSARVASLLEFGPAGVAKVRVDYLGKAPPPGSDASALLASLQTGGAPATTSLVKLAGSDGSAPTASSQTGKPAAGSGGPTPVAAPSALLVSLQTSGRPTVTRGVKLASDAPAPPASLQPVKPPAAAEGARPVAGSSALLVSLQTSGPPAAEPVPLVSRAAPDEGVTVIERAVERPSAEGSRSPYGDLISSPFLVQASARP